MNRKEKKMAKKIEGYIKLQIPAGKANPSPPVGPALGAKGVNIMEFCKQFNARTRSLLQGLAHGRQFGLLFPGQLPGSGHYPGEF